MLGILSKSRTLGTCLQRYRSIRLSANCLQGATEKDCSSAFGKAIGPESSGVSHDGVCQETRLVGKEGQILPVHSARMAEKERRCENH